MGYFSNGSEGCAYEARYCDQCIHQDGPDGRSGCAVWLAHLLYNCKECLNKDSILHLLIPRTKDGLDNEQCKMFIPKESATGGCRRQDAGGFIIEVAPGGPWLTQDGKVTPNWVDRGVWRTTDEANDAWNQSLFNE